MKKFLICIGLFDLIFGVAAGMITPFPQATPFWMAVALLILSGAISAFLVSLASKIAFDEWFSPFESFFNFELVMINWGVVALIISLHLFG